MVHSTNSRLEYEITNNANSWEYCIQQHYAVFTETHGFVANAHEFLVSAERVKYIYFSE